MPLVFTEEQLELRQAVRRFLDEKSPEIEVRRLMASEQGYDPTVWRQMAEQLGLQGLAIPESYGGSGFTFAELCIVLEEMGASLLCAPFFATVVMAAGTLLATDDEDAKGRYLPGIASGDLIGTVALYGDDGRPTLANSSLVARKGPESWLLDGHKSFVIDGHIADLILAVADTPEGLSLFAVSGSAPGLTRTSLLTMDQTRKQARLEFGATPATLIGLAGTAEVPMKTALERVAVALANEQVGGAQHCLDSSVEYAKVRVQFGRPIGSFQAIKHKCADLLMEIEMARSAAYYAAQVASADSDELPAVASLAKSFCSETYTKAASENIQIHGGIGFTWEHGAHLYFKRAKSSELLFGDPDFHRNLLADEIGI